MILTEFTLDHPILREALASSPETTVVHERSNAVSDDRVRVLLWVEGGDVDRFEAAMADDETVTPPERVVDLGDRRLYRTELKDEGLRTSVYPTLVEEGGVIHELTATHEGWRFRAAFPDRESFERFHDFCLAHGIDFDLHRIYERRDADDGNSFGLTAEQKEALTTAVDAGYFEIPREESLAEVADRLGVSGNAASERLRRGTKALVENTIHDGGG